MSTRRNTKLATGDRWTISAFGFGEARTKQTIRYRILPYLGRIDDESLLLHLCERVPRPCIHVDLQQFEFHYSQHHLIRQFNKNMTWETAVSPLPYTIQRSSIYNESGITVEHMYNSYSYIIHLLTIPLSSLLQKGLPYDSRIYSSTAERGASSHEPSGKGVFRKAIGLRTDYWLYIYILEHQLRA